MTLVLKLYLDMVKTNHHTKNKFSVPRNSNIIARTDRQTDSMKNITFPHMRAVKIVSHLSDAVIEKVQRLKNEASQDSVIRIRLTSNNAATELLNAYGTKAREMKNTGN